MDGSHASPNDEAALGVTALRRAHVAGDPDALERLRSRVFWCEPERIGRVVRAFIARAPDLAGAQ